MMTPNDKIRIGEYIYYAERKVIEKVFFFIHFKILKTLVIFLIWINAIFNLKKKRKAHKNVDMEFINLLFITYKNVKLLNVTL